MAKNPLTETHSNLTLDDCYEKLLSATPDELKGEKWDTYIESLVVKERHSRIFWKSKQDDKGKED